MSHPSISSLIDKTQDADVEPGLLVASGSNGSLQSVFTGDYRGDVPQVFIEIHIDYPIVWHGQVSPSERISKRCLYDSSQLARRTAASIKTYPPPDEKLRSYFENHEGKSDKLLQGEYAILLKHIFDEAKSRVPTAAGDQKGSDLAQAWEDYLSFNESDKSVGKNRISFYKDAVTAARKDVSKISEKFQLKTQFHGISPAENSDQAQSYCSLKKSVDLKKLFANMRQSAIELLDLVAPGHSAEKNECFVYFDEAHNLTEAPRVIEGVRYRNPYHNLGSVLAELSKLPIFFIFLSTNTHLQQFAPPASHHPSGRVFEGSYLIPPFTELPFDVFTTEMFADMVKSNQPSSLANACTTQVMSSMGRPLWFAHHTQWLNLPPSGRTLEHVLTFAMRKLTANMTPEHVSQSEVAALSMRIGITFESTTHASREMESQLVESHMRVVYAIPQHREFILTGSSSEPVLAEAAACYLKMAQGGIAVAGPRILFENCQKGFVARGERGELCGRLLMTIAHDLALPDTPDDTLQLLMDPKVVFHRPVPVLAFLRALFADTHHDTILEATPGTDETGEKLRDAFKDAYVSFSHFVRAGDSAMLGAESLRTALFRGMAIQAKDNQVSIDAVIPIHMGPITSSITTKTTSAINLQFKNRKRTSPCSVDRSITVPDFKQPVISIVFQFGEEPSKHKQKGLKQLIRSEHWDPPESQISTSKSDPCQDDRHYLFVARGCGPDTYKAIPKEAEICYDIILASSGLKEHFPRANRKTSWSIVQSLRPAYTAELCWKELNEWDRMGSSATPSIGSNSKGSIIPDNGQGLRTNARGDLVRWVLANTRRRNVRHDE
ncbi:hypothetical protein B0J17DRAFT_112629 [Rhizoctonia solani]|nr:hypothetical protein B0J17DRAFT_112629 [Rhizoctonia solani]